MATKRRPKGPEKRLQVPEQAVEIFKAMQDLPKCECVPPPADRYWGKVQCESCARWWDLHDQLHPALLGETVFDWPCIANPTRYRRYHPDDLDAGAMYLELERLSGRSSPDFWARRGL